MLFGVHTPLPLSNQSMNNPKILAVAVAAVLLSYPSMLVAQLHKCISNGSVTYQNTPCPSGDTRKPPTVEELNAERKKKLDLAKVRSPNAYPKSNDSLSAPHQSSQAEKPDIIGKDSGIGGNKHTASANAAFKCDSRKYCSQMSSCAEATYFLANCPGVKMDGNKDGTPCEQQWCGR